jgi:hypothetical protein
MFSDTADGAVDEVRSLQLRQVDVLLVAIDAPPRDAKRAIQDHWSIGATRPAADDHSGWARGLWRPLAGSH